MSKNKNIKTLTDIRIEDLPKASTINNSDLVIVQKINNETESTSIQELSKKILTGTDTIPYSLGQFIQLATLARSPNLKLMDGSQGTKDEYPEFYEMLTELPTVSQSFWNLDLVAETFTFTNLIGRRAKGGLGFTTGGVEWENSVPDHIHKVHDYNIDYNSGFNKFYWINRQTTAKDDNNSNTGYVMVGNSGLQGDKPVNLGASNCGKTFKETQPTVQSNQNNPNQEVSFYTSYIYVVVRALGNEFKAPYIRTDGTVSMDMGYTPTDIQDVATKSYVDNNTGMDYSLESYAFRNSDDVNYGGVGIFISNPLYGPDLATKLLFISSKESYAKIGVDPITQESLNIYFSELFPNDNRLKSSQLLLNSNIYDSVNNTSYAELSLKDKLKTSSGTTDRGWKLSTVSFTTDSNWVCDDDLKIPNLGQINSLITANTGDLKSDRSVLLTGAGTFNTKQLVSMDDLKSANIITGGSVKAFTTLDIELTTLRADINTINNNIGSIDNDTLKKDGSVLLDPSYNPTQTQSIATKAYVDGKISTPIKTLFNRKFERLTAGTIAGNSTVRLLDLATLSTSPGFEPNNTSTYIFTSGTNAKIRELIKGNYLDSSLIFSVRFKRANQFGNATVDVALVRVSDNSVVSGSSQTITSNNIRELDFTFTASLYDTTDPFCTLGYYLQISTRTATTLAYDTFEIKITRRMDIGY